MKYKVHLVCNTWPEGASALESLEKHLGSNFEITKGLGQGDLLVYVRVPWNKLLKQCVRQVPEFKQDDQQRRELKQSLSGIERALDKRIEQLEDEWNVLILDDAYFENEVAIQVSAELIKQSVRRK